MRTRGFTLIEILIVVVILGVASAVIVPHLGTHNDQSVAAAARVVTADLLFAQNYAITNQMTVYVPFDLNAGSYSLLSAAPNAGTHYLVNPLTSQNYVGTFGAGGSSGLSNAALASASFDGRTCLGFDELGTPLYWDQSINGGLGGTATMNSGSIGLSSGSCQLTVSLEAYTGALSVH